MVRTKTINGRTPAVVANELKKRLSMKRIRNSIKDASNLNQTVNANGDTSQRQSLPVYLNRSSRESDSSSSSSPSHLRHAARKSITNANRSFGKPKSYFARKSFVNYPNARVSARQSGIKGDNIEKTSSAASSSAAVSSSSKNIPDKIIKKARKSGNCLRPFAPTRVNHRRKPGVLALQQIRYYQRETGMLIPRLSFQRVVKEVLHNYTKIDYRIQREALAALQEAAEMFLVRKFENGQLCAVHANRVTLMTRDFTLLKYFEK